ncbi:cysteine desulfurase-like protein [Dictyobacter kobayashii]|uniref:Cysteine desulfurase-like protein n=1 Tax=Dictyobacter kobayashii TaxID=2014872 RepID=A0A402ALA8_9CHLR|nr:cysteine desulfurase-like protein [Dictyobacter kobayashii]GCE19804.1 cysteine desulfurase-like protein [Dictyobacter kobayashii]
MLNIDTVRAHFPSLATGATFFDNPGGTQVAQEVVERMQQYFLHSNANHGGAFRTSQASDAVVAEAREAVAAFLGAARPEEIIFGQNMTSLTFNISRSIARLLEPGDELVVTRLDHDANIAPWLWIAEDRGCKVRWVDFHAEDCTLDMQAMEEAITPRTKLVAVGYASNAVGTINNVQQVVRLAHQVGALCFVDAVQYAPHKSIDVQTLDCDLLACSAYKFFGPHTGILYGKYELLERLTAYKVRPAGEHTPDKFETGTQSYESIAGVLGALEYLAWLGMSVNATDVAEEASRELALRAGMQAVESYENSLSLALLEGLQSVPGLRLWGITDVRRIAERVPTFSFTLPGWNSRALAEQLAREEIYVWSGNFYALAALERLGLDEQGGILRVGLAHYNTHAEITRLISVLKNLPIPVQ